MTWQLKSHLRVASPDLAHHMRASVQRDGQVKYLDYGDPAGGVSVIKILLRWPVPRRARLGQVSASSIKELLPLLEIN